MTYSKKDILTSISFMLFIISFSVVFVVFFKPLYYFDIHHLKLGNDEVLVIKNFGQGFHNKTYVYNDFPQNSDWQEVFNSDAKKYGGSGYVNQNKDTITNKNQQLFLAPNSIIILKTNQKKLFY